MRSNASSVEDGRFEKKLCERSFAGKTIIDDRQSVVIAHACLVVKPTTPGSPFGRARQVCAAIVIMAVGRAEENSFSPFGVDCPKCARCRQWAGAQNQVIAITLRDRHAPNSSDSDLSTPYHWALSHCGTAPIIWLQFTRNGSGTWCTTVAGIEAQSPAACWCNRGHKSSSQFKKGRSRNMAGYA